MSEWIRMDERRPDIDQKVLYYFEMVGIHVGRYGRWTDEEGYEHDVFSGPSGFLTDDVTHWMPLPEPPNG